MFVAALGVLGLLALLWRGKSRSTPATYSIWAVLGGILASAIVGVMSVAPWVLLAGGLLLLAALPGAPRGRRGIGAATGSFIAGLVLTLLVLYGTTIRWGIDEVQVPAESLVGASLSPVDYSDAFRVHLPTTTTLDAATRADVLVRSLRPCWVEPPPPASSNEPDQAVGEALGDWPIYHNTEDELVVGLNRSFIDLRLSFLLVQSQTEPSVVVSTVARFNDWRGRLYFLPVRVAHRIVLADAMRRIQSHLSH